MGELPGLLCLRDTQLIVYSVNAPADSSSTESSEGGSPLGLIPHQLRGMLGQWKTMLVEGEAYDKCTGCSGLVSPGHIYRL